MIDEEKFLDVFTDITGFYDKFKPEKGDATIVPGTLRTSDRTRQVTLRNPDGTKEFKLTKYLTKDPIDTFLIIEGRDYSVSSKPFSYLLKFTEEGFYYEGDYLDGKEEKDLHSFYLNRYLEKSEEKDQIEQFDYESLEFISKFYNKSLNRLDTYEDAKAIGVMPDRTFPVKSAYFNFDAVKNALSYISERKREYVLDLKPEPVKK